LDEGHQKKLKASKDFSAFTDVKSNPFQKEFKRRKGNLSMKGFALFYKNEKFKILKFYNWLSVGKSSSNKRQWSRGGGRGGRGRGGRGGRGRGRGRF